MTFHAAENQRSFQKEFKISAPAALVAFIEELQVLTALNIPIQLPAQMQQLELLRAAAAASEKELAEIDAEDVQDAATLLEQTYVDGDRVLVREGVLASSMQQGRWLAVHAREREHPVIEFVIASSRSAPSGFQLFVISGDYTGQAGYSKGSTYAVLPPPTETPAQFLARTVEFLYRVAKQPAAAKQPMVAEETWAETQPLVPSQAVTTAQQTAERQPVRTQAIVTTQAECSTPHRKTTEHLLVLLLSELGRHLLEAEVLDEVLDRIRTEAFGYHAFMQMLQRAAQAVRRHGELRRIDAYLILSEIIFARYGHEKRREVEQALRHTLCLQEKEVSEQSEQDTIRILEAFSNKQTYTMTSSALRVMRHVVSGADLASSFLLIGETGTGKTTAVQQLFRKRRELLGSHAAARKILCVNLSKDTDVSELLGMYQFATPDVCANMLNDLLQGYFHEFFDAQKNEAFLHRVEELASSRQHEQHEQTAREALEKMRSKQATRIHEKIVAEMERVLSILARLRAGAKNICVFVEGPLTRAMRYGYWILLDESNLAPLSTLRCLNRVLQRKKVALLEDRGRIVNMDARTLVFQCVNPGDDHGKKDIAMDRTLTLTMDEVDAVPEDVSRVAHAYNREWAKRTVDSVTSFYAAMRKTARDNGLRTGGNRAALFGIRNLIRTIQMGSLSPEQSIEVNFLTQLSQKHKAVGVRLLAMHIPSTPALVPAAPPTSQALEQASDYVETKQTAEYARYIRSAVEAKVAVLLEGSTSVGKTSLVRSIAKEKKKVLVRINNHEHTDVAEYLGHFGISPQKPEHKQTPKKRRVNSQTFAYKEGVLVRAVREGHWVLLDELNLAPTEVLECLNRLLDSNRELFVPGTQECIRAHEDFALFATQNPAESADYKNRKHLSKAFRNRFVEIYVEDKTKEEVEAILLAKKIGKVHARVLLEIYEQLRILTNNRTHEYITLRDLMKVVHRFQHVRVSYIEEGIPEHAKLYMHVLLVVTEKLRCPQEKKRIEQIIELSFEKAARVRPSREQYAEALEVPPSFSGSQNLLLTPSVVQTLRKMETAWRAQECVLLVGAPGIGKTYLSECLCKQFGSTSTTMSMHAGIELTDFIGGYIEERSGASDGAQFVWRDGPLLTAMKQGHCLIIDEVNLAPDSVLESLNQVFDERVIRVHELDEEHPAHPEFRIIGTMNPGDDHGKREVGKSVSSRFTVIHVEPLGSNEEALKYIMHYANTYSLIGIHSASDVYRAANRAISSRRAQIRSAREAEVIARYVSLHPGTGQKGLLVHAFEQALDMLQGTEAQQAGELVDTDTIFGIAPFVFPKPVRDRTAPPGTSLGSAYTFSPSSIRQTLFRILQAVACSFNVLLEGPPGTGKTRIITETGTKLGKRVTRINLSRETEISDLAGRVVPGPNGICFAEGEFVRAARRGDWIIIDEINLATQSVIEGLNSCLDYRRQMYVPEIGAVQLHRDTVIFATMNPKTERNDGRKILPQSFLSRFIRVFRGPLTVQDLRDILLETGPQNAQNREVLIDELLSMWRAYDLNLRDCLRHMAIGSLHLVPYVHKAPGFGRSALQRAGKETPEYAPKYTATADGLSLGSAFLPCTPSRDPEYVLAHENLIGVEALLHGLVQGWPCVLRGPLGKGRLIRFVSEVTQTPLLVIPCHKDMEPSDFLGKYVQAQTAAGPKFVWEDSEFVRAAELGSIVMLKNANLVRNDVMDRLNSLFEPEGCLEIHEQGGSHARVVRTHSTTRFVLALSEGAKDLSPALCNRSIVCSLSPRLTVIDIAKMLQAPARAGASPSFSRVRIFVPSGLLHAHLKLRSLSANCPGALLERRLRSLTSNPDDLEKEAGIRNSLLEAEIVEHIRGLADSSIEEEVTSVFFGACLDPEASAAECIAHPAFQALVRSTSEKNIEEQYRAFYRSSEYEKLKSSYKVFSAYAKAHQVSTSPRKHGGAKKHCKLAERMLATLSALRSSSGDMQGLRAYFEAIDLPFLKRSEASVCTAKLRFLQAVLDPHSEHSRLAHLPAYVEVASILDTISNTLEKDLAQVSHSPPAYSQLVDLLDACVQCGIDPLLFEEVEEVERAASMQVLACIHKVQQRYLLYKYGRAAQPLDAPPPRPPTSPAALRRQRKARHFPKFAAYLKGVVRDIEQSETPEVFSFSLIRRDMSKYADLWECFAYAVLRNGVERISRRGKSVIVHRIGRIFLQVVAHCIKPEEGLQEIARGMKKSGQPFLGLSPLHARCVRVLWHAAMDIGHVPDEATVRRLISEVVLEVSLAGRFPDLSSDGEVYALDEKFDRIFSTASILQPAPLNLTVTEASPSPCVHASQNLVGLLIRTRADIETARATAGTDYDWKEDNGARMHLLERADGILSSPLSVTAPSIAASLDVLNTECTHMRIHSVALNTARVSIYRDFASIDSYNLGMYVNTHSGWLLHLFCAAGLDSPSGDVLVALEEFLLQSTIGDMEEKTGLVRQAAERSGVLQQYNLLVYFLPYLEVARRKKEAVAENLQEHIKHISVALSVKSRSNGVLVPLRESTVISRAKKLLEDAEELATPVLAHMRPHLFARCPDLKCNCGLEECPKCLARGILDRKKVLEREESTSVKLRALGDLLEKVGQLVPGNTSRARIVVARDFYNMSFAGSRSSHIMLAKILHISGAVFRAEPKILFRLAVPIRESAVRLQNHAFDTDNHEIYPLALVVLGVFLELLEHGLCNTEDQEEVEELLEQLEGAGMRLGEGDQNISEKLKNEDEVGDEYKGEKEKEPEHIGEEDGVDLENAGEAQETKGSEQKDQAEIEEGAVSDEESAHQQRDKEDREDEASSAEKENEQTDTEGDDSASLHTESGPAPSEPDLSEVSAERSQPVSLQKEDESGNENESVHVQSMEVCEEAGKLRSSEEPEEASDCNLSEHSLSKVELEEGNETDEEISVEHYSSDDLCTNIQQYDFEELVPNTEQLFPHQEDQDTDDGVGHESGDGAEKEIAVGKGEQTSEQAEDAAEDPLYTGEYREAPTGEETAAPAPFRPGLREIDPQTYYESIRHLASPELTKQLSVVLEENERAGYEGDYATGRRLNMKRILAYVASQGQRNRIWLRKTRNAGRDYLLRIFVDNSGSVKKSGMVVPLIKSLVTITNSLDLLGVPFELGTFSSTPHIQKNMLDLIRSLTFAAQETRISWISGAEYAQGYNIVISDGLFYDSAMLQNPPDNTLLLIIGGCRIKEMRSVKVVLEEVIISKYLEALGLPYCIVDDKELFEIVFVRELKSILSRMRPVL